MRSTNGGGESYERLKMSRLNLMFFFF